MATIRRDRKILASADERGATLIEYSILLGMLILIGLASVRAIGTKVSTSFSTISSTIE